MRINHELKQKLEDQKVLTTTWKKNFQSGVTLKQPYMSGARPTSYQKLFIEFDACIGRTPKGVSGKRLRALLGWNPGSNSDYFAVFTTNDILKYNRSTRKYEKGSNYDLYMRYSMAKSKEL